MGALNSIHDKLKEFSEVEEEYDQEFSTPQRTMRHKCLAGVDPRSPTEDIDRTPIIVEGTPNVVLSKGIKSRIPSQTGGPVDPRSPSSDFTRTPLSFGQTSSDSTDTPLKAPSHFIPPLSEKGQDFKVDEPLQDKMSTEEQLCDILNQSASCSDKENTSTIEESLEESYDTAPLLEGTEKLHMSSIQGSKKSNSSSEQETESEDSFSSQKRPKCRQVNRILSQNTSMPKIKIRSALTPVENSTRVSRLPKKIVTTSKIGKINPNHANSSVAVDKENVCN